MEWKEANFDAQPAWVKEGTRDVFYAEPVGMQKPSWDERAARYRLGASRLSRGAKSGSAGTASRSRGRLRDVSRRVGLPDWLVPVCWIQGGFFVTVTHAWRVVVHGKVVCEF